MSSTDFEAEDRRDESGGFGGSGSSLESRANSFDSRALGSEDSGFWESSRPDVDPSHYDTKKEIYFDHDSCVLKEPQSAHLVAKQIILPADQAIMAGQAPEDLLAQLTTLNVQALTIAQGLVHHERETSIVLRQKEIAEEEIVKLKKELADLNLNFNSQHKIYLDGFAKKKEEVLAAKKRAEELEAKLAEVNAQLSKERESLKLKMELTEQRANMAEERAEVAERKSAESAKRAEELEKENAILRPLSNRSSVAFAELKAEVINLYLKSKDFKDTIKGTFTNGFRHFRQLLRLQYGERVGDRYGDVINTPFNVFDIDMKKKPPPGCRTPPRSSTSAAPAVSQTEHSETHIGETS